MENNGLSGGMYQEILGHEMALHQPNPSNLQNPQNPSHQHVHHQHHQPGQNMLGYGYSSHNASWKTTQQSPLSEDDDPGENNDACSEGKRNNAASPWQRMKWTDNMVRLLITAVYFIGDEYGSDQTTNEPNSSGKKKGGSGLLQKKGKWKSVSRAMLEKGFYVSPQQCEDKFNDLNKRYKRVNDILGRGTACQVVENQSLLETMDLSPKMKEEVRKLLNSKHLFFREMCAYHNSCGHGSVRPTSNSNGNHSTEMAAGDVSQAPSQPPAVPGQPERQMCSHFSENVQFGNPKDEDDEDEEDDSDEDDFDDDDEGQDGIHKNGEVEEDHEDCNNYRKRQKSESLFSSSSAMQKLTGELASMMQDRLTSLMEKKQWIQMKMIQLEEQQLSHQQRAFNLEKQRLKWVKFSGKKEREMERAKLENERKRLQSERMLLLLRQNELELLDSQRLQQQSSSGKRASDPKDDSAPRKHDFR